MRHRLRTLRCSRAFAGKSISLVFAVSKTRWRGNREHEISHAMPFGMHALSLLPDAELLALVPRLVANERGCLADLLEHLLEVDRRRLYADAACSSLSGYCIERLGFAEDEAFKRVRVARLASRFPRVLDELRTGAIHLTGLFLLSQYLTDENHFALLDEARGKTKRQVEALIARHFPKPDVPERVVPVAEQVPMLVPGGPTCSGASSTASRGREQPLSATRWLVQFSAGSELHDKIERARELSSHAVPGGELEIIFDRALDLLIAEETKKKQGAGKPRKAREQRPGSRHVPVETRRAIEERDEGRCSFVDEEGRRCTARRFITVEHEN